MTRDELVEDLLSRVEEARDSYGADLAILDADVQAKAMALAQMCPDSDLDLAIACTLGALHWTRRQFVPDEFADAEVQTAMWWYARVHRWYPELVPEELRPMVSGREPLPDGPQAWSDQAARWLGDDLDSAGHEALNRAIALLQRSVSGVMSDDPRHADYSSSLCRALRARFELTGSREDLALAVEAGRQATAGVAAADPDRPVYLSVLGHVLGERYRLSGEAQDADEGVAALEQAIGLTGREDANRARYLVSVSALLLYRYLSGGREPDLSRAIESAKTALDDAVADAVTRAGAAKNYGNALGVRYERTGNHADLLAAITALRQAAELTRHSPAGGPAALASLAGTLYAGFEMTGAIELLDEAISAARRGVDESPDGHTNIPSMLSNLSAYLLTRFEHLGVSSDLDDAVTAARQAVAATPGDDRRRASYLANLGLALRARYQSAYAPGDISDVIATQQESVATLPPGHPLLAGYLANLASSLRARFAESRDIADLNEAVTLTRRAVALGTGAPLERARLLAQLSMALRDRYDHTSADADIADALAAAGQVLDLIPADHSAWARRVTLLGTIWHARFDHAGEQSDRDRALGLYQQAMTAASAPKPDQVAAANMYAVLAASARMWADASCGFDVALAALPMLTQLRITRSDRQHRLVPIQGIGSHAAAAALELGDIERAWEVLEQGRGILIGQELGVGASPAALRRDHADLAREADRLRLLLSSDPPDSPASAEAERSATARAAAADEWQKLTARIRRIPDFARFGLPLTMAELKSIAGMDTIVAITTAGDRGDALIIAEGEVSSLRLPGLTREAAVYAGNMIIAATQMDLRELPGKYPVPADWRHPSAAAEPDPDHRLPAWRIRAVLSWLWQVVAEPVLACLGHNAVPGNHQGWPRLVWLPTGAMTILPIHAAGDYREYGTSPKDSVADRVVSSYTSTMRTLEHARHVRDAEDPRSDLVVGVDVAQNKAPLAMVPEAQSIARRLGTRALINEQATRTAVLERLASVRWAHFSCHGLADDADPMRSYLALHDGPLKVGDLIQVSAPRARMAYLSACMTAFGGARLLDESTHLASVLQVAGFPHVVGTLWPVPDLPARHVAEAFYQQMIGGADPAMALHRAIGQYTAKYGWRAPEVYAAYTHYGPPIAG